MGVRMIFKRSKKFWFSTLFILSLMVGMNYVIQYKRYGMAIYFPGVKIHAEKFNAKNIAVSYVDLNKNKAGKNYYLPVFDINGEHLKAEDFGLQDIIFDKEKQPKFVYNIVYYRLHGDYIIIDEMDYQTERFKNYNFSNYYKDGGHGSVLDEINKSATEARLFFYLFVLMIVGTFLYKDIKNEL